MVVKTTNIKTTFWLISLSVLVALFYCYFAVYPQLREGLRVDIKNHDQRRERWIQSSTESFVDGEYNTTALKQLCASTNWQPGLVSSCDKLQGGLGNVRNIALNCIRFTIEAGSGLIIPRIVSRGTYDISKLNGENTIPFEEFFDREYFVSTLKENCPQMQLYDSLDKLWDVPSLAVPIELSPEALRPVHKFNAMLVNPVDWRSAFDKWLGQRLAEPRFAVIDHRLNKASPVRINMHKSLFSFPVDHDDPNFSHQFGRLLRLRPDTQRLAAHVIMNLSDRFNLSFDPTKHGIQPNKYMGAHLRTEADAAKAGWTSYDFQKDRYIRQALGENIQVMYIASGDADAIQRLKTLAESEFGIFVVTKWDLLDGPEKEQLRALTWDQQGLVDYEVMMKSSTFGGVHQSSFACNLGIRRNLASNLTLEEATHSTNPRMPWSMVDENSLIYGDIGASRWFTETMWA